MVVTRPRVLERLAAASDAEARETTTTEALAATLDADEAAVASHLDALSACELARVDADGRARVTVTGEEALELPTEGIVVVDAPPRSED
jgi:predicted ArsR family transcriptional regulator